MFYFSTLLSAFTFSVLYFQHFILWHIMPQVLLGSVVSMMCKNRFYWRWSTWSSAFFMIRWALLHTRDIWGSHALSPLKNLSQLELDVVTYIVVGLLLFMSSTNQFFELVLYYEISRWWVVSWWSPTFSRSKVFRLTSSMPWLSLVTLDSTTKLAILSWPRAEIITMPMICSNNSYFSDP